MGLPGIEVKGDGTSQTLRGTSGDDAFTGSNAMETFSAGMGDDTVYAGGGDDVVFAEIGNDWLHGGSGVDTISFLYVNIGDYIEFAESGVTVDLAINRADFGVFGLKTIASFENVNGTLSTDVVLGSAVANIITGYGGNDHLDGREGNDSIFGGIGDDTLLGGSGDDVIEGGLGSDRFYSGSGADTLSASEGTFLTDDGARDTFIFTSTSYSPSSATRDTIYGFFDGATGDKIDLSRIDANGSAAGDGSFTFIGANSIGSNSTSQVQVRATAVDDQYLVRIDTDSDSSAEMQILVYSTSALTSADFIL